MKSDGRVQPHFLDEDINTLKTLWPYVLSFLKLIKMMKKYGSDSFSTMLLY